MEFPAKRWIRPRPRAHAELLLDRLFEARGLCSMEAREAFCRPNLKQLQEPEAMHGMTEAADAICEGLRAGKRIAIYGDYDVDGIMATATLWHMLKVIAPTTPVRTYVPHRIEEGYGLNREALSALRADGIDTIITVDCGVSAIDEAKHARAIGLELIITDHHELHSSHEVPIARAVVHPRLGGAQTFGDLCGAGVAWKLAWMIAERWCGSDRLPKVFADRLLSLLPLAAIGTVADVVPLLGENRVIVARGLTLARSTGIAGLDALLEAARAGDVVDAEQIAFRVAPRLNACGRMGHPEEAVELLTTADRRRAAEIVAKLEDLNADRKTEENRIFEEALARVEARFGAGNRPRGIVLADETWNLGVVGIVCSRLVDRFACPAILFTRNKDVYKGSGRSVAGVELHSVLATCADHLVGFGGHAMAAGMSAADLDQIDRFTDAFTREVDALLPPAEEQRPPLGIDASCEIGELDIATVQAIDQLAPFGRENRKPALLLESAKLTQIRPFGKAGAVRHLELVVSQPRFGRDSFLRIQWWDGARHAESLEKGMILDLVIEPGLDRFRGKVEPNARLVDLAVAAVGSVR
jgi:single-stranded-DNA-specific exonuclease